MRLEPTPKPSQVQRVSPKLITSNHILHLSSDELEREVNQEENDNPALNVTEQRICLYCSTPLFGENCTFCRHSPQPTLAMSELAIPYDIPVDPLRSTHQQFYDFDNSSFAESDHSDDFDLLANIPAYETLAEILLQQLEALVRPGEELIAEQLVGNLDERGFLEISVTEIAELLHVPSERVEYVLHQLHTLEPLGIGARNLRECLLIQLQALQEQEKPHPLAFPLIDRYLDQMLSSRFSELARALKVSEHEVRQASLYIGSTLHPYPAHTYRAETHYIHLANDAIYIRPDVLISKNGSNYEVELIEEKRYSFSISTDQPVPPSANISADLSANEEMHRFLHSSADRAKFFIDCVQRRWRTLKRVAELIVDYQREFLEKGNRFMRPLTRAEVATRLELDESTVSRAIANKYALLPNGHLIPFSDFFDSSLSAKDVLRELIAHEESNHPWSDDELAHLMQARGIPMARRTVTKYRKEMGIGSSRER